MERREAFKRWLLNVRIKKTGRSIPINTVEHYARSIHKLSDVMYEEGVIAKRLYSMKETDEVKLAIAKIKKERTYLDMNQKSENTIHKALNYYASFIEETNAKKQDKPKE